jgi:adenine-specific DNA-methyltransferase
LSSKKNINLIRTIERTYENNSKFLKISVKNGFATLCDNIFVGKIDIKDDCIIDVIKASTGRWAKCIFPYNSDGTPISESELKNKHGLVYSYLKKYREKLKRRDIERNGNWFLFGRSQGVKGVF